MSGALSSLHETGRRPATHPGPAAGAGSGLGVTVVICAYTFDRYPQILAAVESVVRQQPSPAQVLVVVDHCPGLAEALRAALAGEPLVSVLENVEARGLSGARNTGVRAATGEVLAFLDDDAVARPGWLAALLDGYAQGDDVLGVGGAARAAWSDGRPSWFPVEFDWVVGCSYRGLPDAPEEVRNFIGANMSYRTDVFAAAGGFRSDLGRVGTTPLGCEETEFGIRVHRALGPARCLYLPHAAVDHLVPPQRATLRYYLRRCYGEGLSKAAVSGLSGGSALATERRYVQHVLPAALWENLLGRRGPGGTRRAAAVVLGLVATASGYLRGRSARLLEPTRGTGPLEAS